MKPVSFRYERPSSVDEAVALLGEHGDEAKVLAGGQSLMPLLNMRVARPTVLVDINCVGDLGNVARSDGSVSVGAVVRQAAFRGICPLGDLCLPYVGHHATRNRGTVAGSIVHADASAELPLALLLAGGAVVADSVRGRRTIAADELFVTHYTTELQPHELVVETVWPEGSPGAGYAFEELAQRRGDYALCMAAAVADGDELRVGVGSVVERPTLLEVDPDAPGESAAAQVEPFDGLHASARYLRNLARVLVDRAVAAARARARVAGEAEP